jgi:hypothetical protein
MKLTIGEMLDENGTQQRVVGSTDLDDWGRTQART